MIPLFLALRALAASPASPGEPLAHYDAVRVALVADNLVAAEAAARELATGGDAALATAAQGVGSAPDLASARAAFSALSRAYISELASQPSPPKVSVYHCPMYQGFAWWVQPKAGIANPYLGQQMPGCGEEMSLKAAAKAASTP